MAGAFRCCRAVASGKNEATPLTSATQPSFRGAGVKVGGGHHAARLGRIKAKAPADGNHAQMRATERESWLRSIEARTRDYREGIALQLEHKARTREKHARLNLNLDRRDVLKAGKWFRSRASGQRYRFSNAIACGEGPNVLRITCQACGTISDRPLSCGATLACLHCRGKLQSERRAMLSNGHHIITRRAHRVGLLRPNRKGGRWTDKLITLTIPHLREHSIGDRIELVHKAWPHFLKSFNAWLRTSAPRGPLCSKASPCGSCESCLATWYGAHEWTVGDDGKGHPHVQLWFFGPYVDCDVSELWRSALEKAGLGEPVDGGFRWEGDVNCDVRTGKKLRRDGIIYEICKYVVKDIVADGEQVPAPIYSELFEALDRRRLRRGSKGFIALCETPIPCACGAVECYSTRVVERPDPSAALEREAIEGERAPP